MNTRKITIKASQLDGLLDEIMAMPSKPVGQHLTDEEFKRFCLQTASASQFSRIDAHLASCSECTEEVERMLESVEGVDIEEIDPLITTIPVEIVTQTPSMVAASHQMAADGSFPQESQTPSTVAASLIERVVRFFDQVYIFDPGPQPPPLLAARKTGWEGSIEDNLLGYVVEEDEEGNLSIWFSSHELGLAGLRVAAGAGSWQSAPAVLRIDPDFEDEVCARIDISRKDRDTWPQGAELKFHRIP